MHSVLNGVHEQCIASWDQSAISCKINLSKPYSIHSDFNVNLHDINFLHVIYRFLVTEEAKFLKYSLPNFVNMTKDNSSIIINDCNISNKSELMQWNRIKQNYFVKFIILKRSQNNKTFIYKLGIFFLRKI